MTLSVRRWMGSLTALTASAFALVGISLPAHADYSFAPFDLPVAYDFGSLQLSGAPAGNYTGYEVSVDWEAVSGDPYSEEALWSFSASNDPNTYPFSFYYEDFVNSPDGTNNGDPVTLTWAGDLDYAYFGGAAPLYFWTTQDFPGTEALWSNISITLIEDTNPLPPAPPATPIAINSSITGSLTDGEVAWFSFNYTGGELLILDTLGSLLAPDNDTVMALYRANGDFLGANDDIDFPDNALSEIDIPDFAALPFGQYYVAIVGFDGGNTFDDDFNVVSTSTNTGSFTFNIAVVPEPGTITFFAMGGLATLGIVARRRRA